MTAPIRILELRSVRGTGGGPEKTILNGAAMSDPARFKVTVCYLRVADDPLYSIHQRAAALGVDYVEICERRSVDFRAWRQLRSLTRERGIQIVHAHDYKTDLLALALARAEHVIPLTTAHGWTGHTAIERRLYYPADKWLVGRFPTAITVSTEIRTELLKWGASPQRLQVVLNGIDHRAFHRDPQRVAAARQLCGAEPDDIVLGAVGRLEPQKRFDNLIAAAAALVKKHPAIRLLIAGEGGCRPELEALIRRHGLEQRCRLMGHCSDIVGFHHALDVFVQSSDYEGTPNVVLEAMALESDVVATDVGGTGELVRDNIDGLLVPAGSVAALVDAVCAVIADPEATRRRRQSARRRVETDLSFETRMRTVERVYEQLVSRGIGREPVARPHAAATEFGPG